MARTNEVFDAEISKLFGSLSLKAWAPEAVTQVSTSLFTMTSLTLMFPLGANTTSNSEFTSV